MSAHLLNNLPMYAQTMSASVKSVEDHGYILNLGVPEVSAFLSFKDAKKALESSERLSVGAVVDVSILKMSSNGRTCNVMIAPSTIKASHVCPRPLCATLIVSLACS